jgi:hypothetical protein
MKQALTRLLMKRLTAEEQAQLAADVVAWRFSHLSASERQALVQRLSPQLLQAMREGRVGLPLLLARNALRLVGSWWLGRTRYERQAMNPDPHPRTPGAENGWLGPTAANDAPADTR